MEQVRVIEGKDVVVCGPENYSKPESTICFDTTLLLLRAEKQLIINTILLIYYTNTKRVRFAHQNAMPYAKHYDLWHRQQREVEVRRRASVQAKGTSTTHASQYLKQLLHEFSTSFTELCKISQTFASTLSLGPKMLKYALTYRYWYNKTMTALRDLEGSATKPNVDLTVHYREFRLLMGRQFSYFVNAIIRSCTNVFTVATENPQEICVICQMKYESENVIRGLKCNHFFHRLCIDRWLEQRSDCPICRMVIVEIKHFLQSTPTPTVVDDAVFAAIIAGNGPDPAPVVRVSTEANTNQNSGLDVAGPSSGSGTPTVTSTLVEETIEFVEVPISSDTDDEDFIEVPAVDPIGTTPAGHTITISTAENDDDDDVTIVESQSTG